MQEIIFKKNVSKGSRFNQIYIPKYLEDKIQVGDEVEVKLIKKKVELYYSKGLKKLPSFKEGLTGDIFSFLKGFDDISSIFLVGSFLTKEIDYNDIDLVLITEKEIKGFDEIVYNQLIKRFSLKFHILTIRKEKMEHLLKVCPLTRAMFSSYITDKDVNLERKAEIDKDHITFLLMMPEDLLELKLESGVFFDSLRRLATIERFLSNKDINLENIDSALRELIDEKVLNRIRNNEEIESAIIKKIRDIIKIKLKKIRGML